MSRYLRLRANSSSRTGQLSVGPSRVAAVLLLGALSTLIAAIGIPMGAASAASAPRTSTFCGYAANASKSTSVSPATLTPASLQASFTKLKSEESYITANSPSQLKGDFTTLFTYFNKFIAILASVKYNFTKLSLAQEKAFGASDTKQVQAAVKAIDAYVKNVCHLKSA